MKKIVLIISIVIYSHLGFTQASVYGFIHDEMIPCMLNPIQCAEASLDYYRILNNFNKADNSINDSFDHQIDSINHYRNDDSSFGTIENASLEKSCQFIFDDENNREIILNSIISNDRRFPINSCVLYFDDRHIYRANIQAWDGTFGINYDFNMETSIVYEYNADENLSNVKYIEVRDDSIEVISEQDILYDSLGLISKVNTTSALRGFEINFTHTTEGLLSKITSKKIQNGSVENVDSVLLSYDSNDRLKLRERFWWHSSKSEWQQRYKGQYFYDSEGKINYIWHPDLSDDELFSYDEGDNFTGSWFSLINTGSNFWNYKTDVPVEKVRYSRLFNFIGCQNSKINFYGYTTGTIFGSFYAEEHSTRNQYFYTNCQEVSSTSDSKEWNIKLYPNPATDYISIQAKLQLGNSQVEIYDNYGRRVLNQELDNSSRIPISNLEPGVYWCLIKTNTGSYSQLFTKL